ncbi:NAD(P)H-hydrate dehydratase [Vibrio fluvialis]|uniref:NAD(P)H-hydrate dehydratase n=1 Tax=Vibrio fluvialis TaxID=676 RepID=UPI0023800430|nr:NAD(P)H-hydrate dehydratase [Vibrio fluvialis]WDY55138.1 NAD(P)H-hydrate dehydratase [Vibrio fluvialis]
MPLPKVFYTAQQVKQGEVMAAKTKGLEMFSLMERAGQAVFTVAYAQYPGTHHWLVCCGGGNNGGDGYIVACLARSLGVQVTVWQIGDPEQLKGDALSAYYHWLDHGGEVYPIDEVVPDDVDLIVDGLLGTGLTGTVREPLQQLIDTLNRCSAPIVAIDIPSGLCANTGAVLGTSIRAQHTVSFIGLKQGLVTGKARNYVGELHFAGLGVEESFSQQNVPTVQAIDQKTLKQLLPKREPCSHKGSHGKAVIVGGNDGMGGAVILAAQACARVGSGLTATLMHPSNTAPMLSACPEIMAAGWTDEAIIDERLQWCDVLAIGPGLGRNDTALQMMHKVQKQTKPKVMDADALHFLAQSANFDQQRILTPHPAEAAKLMDTKVSSIEADRYSAVKALQKKYGGVVVLKGAGTLVCDGKETYVCLAGNPGMATGGMGDVLTGIIVSLLAQGLSLFEAAKMGVLIHSLAADQNAKAFGERGLLASDLLHHLRSLVN